MRICTVNIHRPHVVFGVGLTCIRPAFGNDVARARDVTPAVVTVNGHVGSSVQKVNYAVSEVAVQSEAFEEICVDVTGDAGLCSSILDLAGLLAISDIVTEVDDFAVVTIQVSVRSEVRTPTPHVLVVTTYVVSALVVLFGEAEASTCAQPRENFGGNVGCGIVAIHLGGIEFHQVRLVAVTEGEAIVGLAGGTFEADVVVVAGSSVVEHDACDVPVCIINSRSVGIHLVVTDAGIGGPGYHFAIAGAFATVLFFPLLSKRHHHEGIHTEQTKFAVGCEVSLGQGVDLIVYRRIFGKSCCLAPCKVVGVLHGNAVLGSGGLGGDEDHTEGCTCTVDGGRSGILKYGNLGDIVGVEEGDVVNHNTVDYKQR